MVAMIGEDHVIGFVQCPHHRHRAQLLPDAGMRCTGHKTPAELIQQKLLGTANQVAVGVKAFRVHANDGLAGGITLEAGKIRKWICAGAVWLGFGQAAQVGVLAGLGAVTRRRRAMVPEKKGSVKTQHPRSLSAASFRGEPPTFVVSRPRCW